MAGESARDVARRRREKAERLNKVADAYEKGAIGEQQTAHALAMLPASGWSTLHDVRWPGKRFANIDHVVIGPGGVFVIDSKAWSGRVEVRDGVLRQNGYKRESAVTDAAEAAMAVAEQVSGLDPYAAKPVLCLVGDHDIEGWARNVMLCTPQNVVAMLVSRPAVLDAATVRRTLMHLQQSLAAATRTTPPRLSWSKATSRTRAARTRVTPRSKDGVRREIWRLLGGLAVIGAMFVGLHALRARSDVAISAGDEQDHPRSLVATQALPAARSRPPLRVKADRAGTVHRVGTLPYLYDGNRFFGVRFTIVNRGKQGWVSQPGTSYSVTGKSVGPRPGGSAIRIREGRVLPDPIRLAPGHRMTGYVVFQVPTGEPITSVSLTVGPGRPKTVIWRIDHQ